MDAKEDKANNPYYVPGGTIPQNYTCPSQPTVLQQLVSLGSGLNGNLGSAPQLQKGDEGYVTPDRRWICESCYEDFKVLFDWQLTN